MDIKEEVRAMLRARRGHWPTIARETGVSHSWIVQFVRGAIDNPTINRLTRLRAFLTQRINVK